ncbi:JAB domain-containing protein [Sphingomonas sp. R86521]|uniref:JAB domain-containing protein n=1 Tax=Sphingomonas sp. R86521 TaxID=3093860 RepID=UPI0036D38862
MVGSRSAGRFVPNLPPVNDFATALALFHALGQARREVVGVAYLDPDRRILGLRHIVGTRDRVDVSVRGIVADALAFDAAAVVMAHNHPSGDARPSERDLAFTRALARGLAGIEVELLDHLVMAGEATTSIRDLTSS